MDQETSNVRFLNAEANVKPLRDEIWVVQPEPITTTKSGIVFNIDQRGWKKPNVGRVVAMSDKAIEESGLQVDDMVVFSKYAGINVHYNDRQFVAMKYDEAVAIYEGDIEGIDQVIIGETNDFKAIQESLNLGT